MIVQRDGASDDVRVCPEPPPPEPVAENHDAVAPRSIFAFQERSSNRRRQTHRGQVARRDEDGLDRLRLTRAGQVEGDAARDGHVLEHVVRVVPGGELVSRHRNVGVPAAGTTLRDRDQPIGILERQRVEENSARQAEHSGIGANADGKSQD